MDEQLLFLAAFSMGWICRIIFDYINSHCKGDNDESD